MRRLVIETAGPACSVALFDGEVLVDWRHEVVGRGHAERLMPLVAEMRVGRPDEILVDRGPGSFTGVRVGLAAAIGLGLGWDVPVRAYGALALLAVDAGEGETLVAVEGGHAQLFVQRFASAPLRPLGPAQSLPFEQVEIGGARVIGNAAARFGFPEDPDVPDARRVLCLPPELRELPPVPDYTRGADAKAMA